MNKRFIIPILIAGTFLLLMFVSIPASEAHVLVVGDPHSNRANYYNEAHETAQYLKEHGYQVKEVYRGNATSKNILKGMYNADAIIYVGQGGGGSYNPITGIAKGPFGLAGADKPILGIGNRMREGNNGPLIIPPFKKIGIPVVIAHACFSNGETAKPGTGSSSGSEPVLVKNAEQTIKTFSQMFTAWKANYLATSLIGFVNGEFIDYSVSGSPISMWGAGYSLITEIASPNHDKFPLAGETTPYDDSAAEKWYDSLHGQPTANAGGDQTVYTGDMVSLDGSRSAPGKEITNYYWKIINKPAGSTASLSGTSLLYPKFKADKNGDYTIQLTVKSEKGTSDPDTIKITAITPTIKLDESTYTNIKGAARVMVTDKVASKKKNQITVKVASFRTENGNTIKPAIQEISLVLTETGSNTGIFQGAFFFDTAKPTRKDGIYVIGSSIYDHIEGNGNEWISQSSVNMPKNMQTWVSKDYFMAPGIFQATYTPEKKSFTKEAKYSFSSNVQGKVDEIVTEKVLDKLTTKPNPLVADVWLIPKGKKTACAHTITNAIGYYRFTNIKPGNYYISVYAKSSTWVPYTYETVKELIAGENTQNFPPDEVPQLSQEAFDAIKKVIGDFGNMRIEYSAWVGGAGLGWHTFRIVVTPSITAYLGGIVTVAGEEYIAWKYKSEAQKFLNDLYNQMIIKPNL